MACGCNNTIVTKGKRYACFDVDPELVGELKDKVICEFGKFLRTVEKGYRSDYQFILEQISLINLIEEGEMTLKDALFYLKFYNTNKHNLNTDKWQKF